MKSLNQLANSFKDAKRLINQYLIETQDEVAEEICEEIKENINGGYNGIVAQGVYKSDTTIENNVITTDLCNNTYVTAKVNGKTYNLGMLMEYGTDPHLISAIDANVLHFQIGGKDIFTPRVNHPGTMPYNNYKNAVDNNMFKYKIKMHKTAMEIILEALKK